MIQSFIKGGGTGTHFRLGRQISKAHSAVRLCLDLGPYYLTKIDHHRKQYHQSHKKQKMGPKIYLHSQRAIHFFSKKSIFYFIDLNNKLVCIKEGYAHFCYRVSHLSFSFLKGFKMSENQYVHKKIRQWHNHKASSFDLQPLEWILNVEAGLHSLQHVKT